MPSAIASDEAGVRRALSSARISTYVNAAGGDHHRAVALYGWNARISSALMLPAHFAEVTTRNAVSDALASVYGPDWPWDATFERSLPSPTGPVFSPRKNLIETRRREPTTGKVIAELKFVFWQSMFTARHDGRLWDSQILAQFPHATGTRARPLRGRIYGDLDAIRQLRNRMAHHEPIFNRNLADDLERILDLIDLRSAATATWVRAMEDASTVLAQRP